MEVISKTTISPGIKLPWQVSLHFEQNCRRHSPVSKGCSDADFLYKFLIFRNLLIFLNYSMIKLARLQSSHVFRRYWNDRTNIETYCLDGIERIEPISNAWIAHICLNVYIIQNLLNVITWHFEFKGIADCSYLACSQFDSKKMMNLQSDIGINRGCFEIFDIEWSGGRSKIYMRGASI